MEPRKTLIDLFPSWMIGGGFFNRLNDQDVPWIDDVNNQALDIEYFGNVSGQKYASPLLMHYDAQPGGLTDRDRGLIAKMVADNFLPYWQKEYATLSLQYSPIQNYDMEEEMKNDITQDAYGHSVTRTDNTSHSKTGTETDAPNLTDSNTHTKTGSEQVTPNLTTTNANNVYGFNSSDAVPTGSSSQQATGTDTTTYNLTEGDSASHTGQNTKTYNTTDADTGTVTNAESGTDTHTRNYKLTRKGNIGVTTSQQMIQSERELWLWHFFYDVVFPDIDRMLTIPIY